jgi:ligand-binding sensor domain-containing protein/AraC-like DNA-binding protein
MESKKSTFPDTLFVDKRGILWIGSMAGLTKYQYKTRQFFTFTAKHGMTGDRIRHIKEDMRGNLWISFYVSYLNRFTRGKFTAFNASHGLEGKKINAIVEDMKGNLLFGTREKGVYKLRGGKFIKYEIKGLSSNHLIITMCEDWEGGLWIGTNKGLFRVRDNTTDIYTTRDGLSNDYIIYITEDIGKNLWVGTLNGLNRVKKDRSHKLIFETLLENNIVSCLFEDREESLWIGTDNSGIKRLKDGKFISYTPIEGPQRKIVLSLFEDRKGDTWIGSLSGELFRCSENKCIESLEITESSVTSIFAIGQDGKGNLWVGTNGKGAFQKKGGTFVNITTRDGLADNVVNSIYCDSRNILWFGTYDGVSRYHNGVIESFRNQDGLLGKIVYNVYEDRNHYIWIATSKGINVIKNGKFTKNNITKYLQDIPVSCIYEENISSDNGGNVFWVATHGAGLKRFKGGKFVSYTTADGMTSNFIYQLLEDEQGNLWMMSDSGVLKVNKEELIEFANGRIAKINCISFGISDGMESTEFFNKTSRNSALKNRKGEFWFVTKKGITIVNPGKIKINKFPPPVIIEDVVFDDRSIRSSLHREENVFKGTTDFVFHFTAPTFLSPGKIKFKYKLDGYDRDWVYLQPGGKRMARYKDLEPGPYTFSVTACNSDGLWSRTGASMAFTLKPFFYETFFFKIAVFIIFLTLVTGGYFLYKKRSFGKKGKYKSSSLHPLFADECIKKLTYLMEIEKLYRDENLSLQSLSKKLSISPHQLSEIINKKLDKNFWDFINTYRIEEAKKLLRDPKRAEQKIISIAFDVGFNTKTAFNNVFKKYTKMTPSQYKKNLG